MCVSLIFVCKMCVFVSLSIKIVIFLRKNGETPTRVLDFRRERDTTRNKIMEIVKDFVEKSYNNNGKPWKSSRILRVKRKTLFKSSEISQFLLFFLQKSVFFMFPFFLLSVLFIVSFFIFLNVSSCLFISVHCSSFCFLCLFSLFFFFFIFLFLHFFCFLVFSFSFSCIIRFSHSSFYIYFFFSFFSFFQSSEQTPKQKEIVDKFL